MFVTVQYEKEMRTTDLEAFCSDIAMKCILISANLLTGISAKSCISVHHCILKQCCSVRVHDSTTEWYV